MPFSASGLSIRHKLMVPVIVQGVLVAVMTGILLMGQQSLTDSKHNTEHFSEVMSELFHFGADIESFLAGDLTWTVLEQDMNNVEASLTATEAFELQQTLSSLRTSIEQFSAAQASQAQILGDVRTLTASSRELSNAYIISLSERLTDDTERYFVSTIERSVIPGALKNTTNNYAIEDMFLSLARGDKSAEEAMALLDETIANTRQDIELLKETPFLEKAEAGLAANLKLKGMLDNYLSAMSQAQSTRSVVVQQHTQLMQNIDQLSKSSLMDTLSGLSSGIWALLAVFIATVSISLVSSLLVSVSITRPLARLGGHIERLAASGGDLSFRLEVARHDELGRLAKGVNQFLESLQSIFSEVTKSGHSMAEAARSVADVTSGCSVQMKAQQTQTNTVVNAAAGIEATVAQAKERAANAARAVEQSETGVGEVVASIRTTIDRINEANDELEAANGVIAKLNDDSQNIGGILDVIRGIADQTNLLALNAAIEAARAGEQGRGFAVVADEVRSLAQRTQASIEEIHSMISKLQDASGKATAVIARGAEKIAGTVESSELAGEGVKAISERISEISTLNLEIAAMMENQLDMANGINQSVLDIRTIADSNADAATDASQFSQSQVEKAETLVKMMSRFRC